MLSVHFLNVGHGDCTIIEHPSGRLTMIDINNSQEYDRQSFTDFLDERRKRKLNEGLAGLGVSITPHAGGAFGLGSLFIPPASLASSRQPVHNAFLDILEAQSEAAAELTDPVAFMQRKYPGRRLWRFVLTHPDLDHMRGLKRLYETVGFDNFWDTSNTKPKPDFRSNADREDWEFYQRLRAGSLGVPVRNYVRGNSLFAFGCNENGLPGGDNIEILSPFPALVAHCNAAEKSNDLSYILRISHANRSIILPGDAETMAWEQARLLYGRALKSDFFKASHHGRDSAYDADTLDLIAPIMTFVSVGRKPATDASRKYREKCDRVVSTRYYGNIELRIYDNGACEWEPQRNRGN